MASQAFAGAGVSSAALGSGVDRSSKEPLPARACHLPQASSRHLLAWGGHKPSTLTKACLRHVPRAAAAAVPVSSSQGLPESSPSPREDREGCGRTSAASQGSGSVSGTGIGSGSGSVTPPACMFVGPLEDADQSTLEEFYRQAKDSYYSGKPLILDEMFDRVEVHLRWLRSPVVQKYPRCSLQKSTTYSDAENDPSQMTALYGVWGSLLALGGFLAAGPTLYTADMVWEHSHLEDVILGIASVPGPMLTTTWLMLCAISTGLGLTLASSSWSALRGLRGGGLVALRGVCPSCTEEVYAFVKVDGREKRPRHKTDCHVCGQRLVFHAIVRQADGLLTATPSMAGGHAHTSIQSLRPRPMGLHSSRDGGAGTSRAGPSTEARGRGSGDASSSGRGSASINRSMDTSSNMSSTAGSSSSGGGSTSSRHMGGDAGSSGSSNNASSSSSSSGTPLATPCPLQWVYGRVYAVAKPEDLRPSR